MGLEVAAGAVWVQNARNGGATYDPESYGYPWRIVLHTIEGGASPSSISGHKYPPHLWYDPADRRLYQTVPFDRAGFALYQASDAPHYTNRARALQVELAGRAAEAADWPDLWLARIAQDVIVPMIRFVRSVGGTVRLDVAAIPATGDIANSARADAPQRFAPSAWATFNSICGHRHVPMGDDHWDPGGLNVRKIAAFAAQMLDPVIEPAAPATKPAATPGENIVKVWQIIDGPQKGSLLIVDGVQHRLVAWPAGVQSFAQLEAVFRELARKGIISLHDDGALFQSMTSVEHAVLTKDAS